MAPRLPLCKAVVHYWTRFIEVSLTAYFRKAEMSDELAENVMGILASVKHIPRERITLQSSLAELGFDSLDTISMLFELENAFQISIPDESARSIRYVHEIVDGIRTLQSASPSKPPAEPLPTN